MTLRATQAVAGIVAAGSLALPVYAAQQDAAQQDYAETAELPEITVTGEKAKRSEFDTATSTEVVKAADLAKNAGVRSSRDVLENSANVVDVGSGNNMPTVRGIDGSGAATGAVAFITGSRPRLNYSIDGRSATYNEAAFGTQSVWDVKQVEVLRGPQSLARGRNAIAGSVVVETNDPSWQWQGAVKLSAGNRKSRQTAAMLSGPLVADNLALRLSIDRQERESHIPLMAYEPVGDPRRVESTTARFKLLYAPADHPEFYSRFILSHTRSRIPQTEAKDNPASNLYARSRPVFETDSTSGVLDTVWQFAPDWTWENKLVYTRYGNDRLSLPMPYGTPAALDGREWQVEPLLRYRPAGGSLKALAGLYLFAANQDERVDFLGARQQYDDRTRNQALFGEVQWQFAPAWSLTAGGRLEREHHIRRGGSANVAVNRDATETVFLPKAEIAWQPDTHMNTGLRITRGFNAGGAGATFAAPFKSYQYRPEYVWNYEWFGRFRLPEKGLTLSSNVFLNHYKDMQFMFYNNARSVEVRNAEKVRTYGAEFAAAWQLTDNLSLNASLGLLKTRVLRHPDSSIQGKRLSRAPAYTAALGADYRLPEGFEIGGKVRFSGSYYSNAQNNETGKIGSYSQTDLYAAYRFKHGRVSLYADNVFDSRRDVFIPGADRRDALAQRPRAVGLAAELNF